MQAQSPELKSFGSSPSCNGGHITNDLAAEVKRPFCSVLLNICNRRKTHLFPFPNNTFTVN